MKKLTLIVHADVQEALADTLRALPAGTGRWRDWLSGREVDAGSGELALAGLFPDAHALPFAVLVPADGGPAA